jgi:predicted RNA-binding Zn ribbon-like protein
MAGILEAHVARAQAFREALRAMLIGHGNGIEQPETAARFNEIAPALHLRGRATSAGIQLESADEGVDFLLGSIVAAVVTAQLDGTWPRLKVCANENCRTGMYDRTRNRTRVWCDASTCGARMRAKSYRRRRRKGTN